MKFNKSKIIILFLVLVLIIGILLIFLFNNKSDNFKETKMKLNFNSRVEKLQEFESGNFYKIGWLQVQGTNIDLPILDYNSGLHDLDYSYGWRNVNYTTNSNREVLLGHNVLNVSSNPMLPNDKLMDFESLMAFVYSKFAEENLYIQYTKDGKEELYLIYAVGFYDYWYDDGSGINNKKELKSYIKEVRDNSVYDYNIDVNDDDTLLTLKTCTRYFGLDEKQEFQIDARKIRDGENIVKYSVKTNENFKKLLNKGEES